LGLSVDKKGAALDAYLVPLNPRDALDERILAPLLYAVEEHHVTAGGLGEAVDELVRQHAVADLEGGDHARRGDAERLDDERADEPKTRTNATSMMTRNSSMPFLRFFFSRSRRSSRRLLIGSP
jgi:hypothetical protein